MDASARRHSCEADLHTHSAELVVDGQRFLIAHAPIHSVEPIADVHIETGHGQTIGMLQVGEDRWPVYCVDAELNILDTPPAKRRSCVLLKSDHGDIGILCDGMRVIDNGALTIAPLPGCMGGERSLVESLAIIDGKVTCVVEVNRLSTMLLTETSGDGMRAAPVAPGEH
jgi:hypothetical protein